MTHGIHQRSTTLYIRKDFLIQPILTLLLLGGLLLPLQAQPILTPIKKARMDSLFLLLKANNKGMGAVSILHKGKEVYRNATGFTDVASSKMADANTQYHIGSISKTFTATMILQLMEQKKLSLQTKLSTYFPEVKNADKITIEHLLRHRSGIFSITSDPQYFSFMSQPMSRQDMLKKIAAYDPLFEPNDQSDYSNSGYILLSMIVEKVSGQDYAQALETMIAKPLQLKRTQVLNHGIDPSLNQARSYQWIGKWEPATVTDPSIPIGAGAIVSTPTELNNFYSALFQGKLLKPATLALMQSTVDDTGLGIFPVPFMGRQGWGHTGGIDGFQSQAAYFPEDQLTISYTTNGVVYSRNEIVKTLLMIYFDQPVTLPEFKPSVQLKEEELQALAGTYSHPEFPLKISISVQKGNLVAQASGQPALPLEAKSATLFVFDPAGVALEFDPVQHTMVLKQGTLVQQLKKE